MFVPPHFHPSRPRCRAPVRLDRRVWRGPRRPGQGHGVATGRPRCGTSRRTSTRDVPGSGQSRRRSASRGTAASPAGPPSPGSAPAGSRARGDGFALRPVTLATGLVHVRSSPASSSARSAARRPRGRRRLPVTRSICSAWFEMRYAASAWDAARALDMAAYSDLVSIAELRGLRRRAPRLDRHTAVRAGAHAGRREAWSPTEVRMRGMWQDAGLGRPLCNPPMFDRSGRLIGTPDVLDPVAGVVGEYEVPSTSRFTSAPTTYAARACSGTTDWSPAPWSPPTSGPERLPRAAAGGVRPSAHRPARRPLLNPRASAVVDAHADRRPTACPGSRMRERLLRHRWVS